MRIPLIKNRILSLLLIFVSFNAFAQSPPETMPEFKFFKLDGTTFTNNDLDKNKLLFFCFFDVTCEHCRHAMEKISLHYKEFKNTALYLITLDNKDGIKNFMDHYGPNLPAQKNVTILQDLQNQFIPKFKPVKYPSIFLYSKNKKLLLFDDSDDNVARALKQIKLPGK